MKPLAISFSRFKRLAETHATPAFFYDTRVMKARYRTLADCFPGHTGILYAVKANPHPDVLSFFRSLGAGFDVASAGELQAALRSGASPGRISFAGPGKTNSEISMAVSKGIGILHVESLAELEAVARISGRLGRRARIGVRVNPRERAAAGGMKMGGGSKPFGIDEEQLPEFFKRLRQLGGVDFKGVHVYAAAQILDARVLVGEMTRAMHVAEKVQKLYGKPLEVVNLGGGFGIPYFDSDKPLNTSLLKRGLRTLFQKNKHRFPRAHFCAESGRFLVGEAGVYCTQILYRKQSRGRTFLITDGGMHHHLAAAGLLGGVFRKNYRMMLLPAGRPGILERVDIAGPLCTPLDLLGRDVKLPSPRPGDILAILNSGAYGASASPQKFLSHQSPGEYVV